MTKKMYWNILYVSGLSILLCLFSGCGSDRSFLSSLNPAEVTAGSDDFALNIYGSGFSSSTTVYFGTMPLIPEARTSGALRVKVPASAVARATQVVVRVSGNSLAPDQIFTVKNPVPVASGLSQTNALANSGAVSLDVIGSNFNVDSVVNIEGQSITPQAATSGKLRILVPESLLTSAQILSVKVVNPAPGGGVAGPLSFTVLNPVPVISGLSTDQVLVNSGDLALTLDGNGFAPGVAVSLGSTPLVVSQVTPTQVSVVVRNQLLAKAGMFSLSASNVGPGGGSSNVVSLTVNNPAPVLQSLSQSVITAGSSDFSLTLSGSDFIDSTVTFGDTLLAPSFASASELKVMIPASSLVDGAIVPVKVMNGGPGGGWSGALSFSVANPAPVLSALSQDSVVLGSGALLLQLTGTGFVHQSYVRFGSTVLSPASYTPTQLSVSVPEALLTTAGSLDISVANPEPGGGGSGPLAFVVQNPVPELMSVSPTSLTTGTSDRTVTLVGSGFVEGATVTLGTDTVTPSAILPTAIQITVPARLLAGPGKLTFAVTNPAPGGGPSLDVSAVVHGRAAAAWRTVVNGKMTIPESAQLFNSYNQASVNARGLVAFKGQGKGGSDSGQAAGIYIRDMSAGDTQPIIKIAATGNAVPQPNNTAATFNHFPSFPRISRQSDAVAFRANTKPVWAYSSSDGSEAKLGSTGVYSNPEGALITAADLLGVVPGFEHQQVPGAPAGTRFDQFPGSPAIVDRSTVVFKGNYTIGDTGKTGVYFRDVVGGEGKSAVQLIANSETVIPGQDAGGHVVFGSTAPPSAENGTVVFVGLDNEDKPAMGGVYSAPMAPVPTLTSLVTIGSQVPGEAAGVTFTGFGEGLSFDGRYVGFWGSWGTEMRHRTLVCGVDGNKDMVEACKAMYPNGHGVEVPVHQGIFVYDLVSHQLYTVASNNNGEFDDFVYWNFSGKPPNESGDGGDVPEPPRWRSSEYVAVDGGPADQYQVVFKAGTVSVDGVYLTRGPEPSAIETLVDTTFSGQEVDPQAAAGSTITSLSMERESLRNSWFALTSSMVDSVTGESGGGIYLTQLLRP